MFARLRRTPRLWLAGAVLALVGGALVVPSFNDETEAAGSTYPVDIAVSWKNRAVAANKPVVAQVAVTAFGRSDVRVDGEVQICEDLRCYGTRKKLADGRATLTADVPRDASGFKSLSIVLFTSPRPTATLPDGTVYGVRSDFGPAIEATVAKFSAKASLVSRTVSRKKPSAKVAVKGYGRNVAQYSYRDGKKSWVRPPAPGGSVTIYYKNKKIGTGWLKGRTSAAVSVSKLGRGTKTVKIKYSGDNYYAGYTIPKARITVR